MFLITTPIPYTNSEPHLGHLLEGLYTDTLARFYRRIQPDVMLTMGLDQHGLKIYEKALEAGQEPAEFARRQGQKFVEIWQQFGIQADAFTATASPEHRVVSQLVWQRLAARGFIYKKQYDGLYCVGCEDFYAPSQLTENGDCPVHRTPPIKMSEENYFFQLSAFQEQVDQFLQTASIYPDYVRREQLNFVQSGLQDISISREKSRLPWGVPVPDDDSQVIYVWFEALINYLTATVNLETTDRWTELPLLREETEVEIWDEIQADMPINIMYASKEIAKFHVVIFPAMLLGCGLELPERTIAHGLINDANGHKFSKSLKNGVLPADIVARIGVDGTRFVMLHEINVDGDTNFDWQHIYEVYNAHLADNIGNLLMRVTTLVEKYLDGQVSFEADEDLKIVNFDYIIEEAEDEGFEHLEVAALIPNHKGKLLIVKRSEMHPTTPGEWHFPAGKIEDEDDILTATSREVKAGLDLNVTVIQTMSETVQNVSLAAGNKTRTAYFLTQATGEIELGTQYSDYRFIDRAGLDELAKDKAWLETYQSLFDFAEAESQRLAQETSTASPYDFTQAYVALHAMDVRGALDVVLRGASLGNEILEKTKPWTLAKEGKTDEVKQVLTSLSILLRDLAITLSIFLPDTAAKMLEILTADRITKAPVLFPKVEME